MNNDKHKKRQTCTGAGPPLNPQTKIGQKHFFSTQNHRTFVLCGYDQKHHWFCVDMCQISCFLHISLKAFATAISPLKLKVGVIYHTF